MIVSGENMRIFTRILSAAVAAAVLFSAHATDVYALIPSQTEDGKNRSADIKADEYTLIESEHFDFIDADVSVFEHNGTKANVVLIQNDDPEKFFALEFATPVSDDKGAAHVLEHSIFGGCEKYPSANLASAIRSRSYTTFLNAFTEAEYTLFPAASLSEDMLLNLADYVADSCFEPMILRDEDIFRSEAWRLAPADDGGLQINGTVWSEMKGKYTPDIAAIQKAVGLLDRESPASYEYGGIPQQILKLSYDDVKAFYDKYYNAQHCTAYLYGDIRKPEEFLALLDTYFDENGKEESVADAGQDDLSEGFVLREFDIAFAALTDEGGSSEMVYAVDPVIADEGELEELYAFTKCCNMDGSTPRMYLQDAFPGSDFKFNILNDAGYVIFYVSADRMPKEDAQAFGQIMGQIFSAMTDEGLEKNEIETFKRAMETDVALSREGSGSTVNLLRSMANYHSGSRQVLSYLLLRERMADMEWFDVRTMENMASKLAKAPRSALAVINPRPDLQKRLDDEIDKSLKKLRDSMSDADMKKLSEDTKRITDTSSDDPSEYIDALSVVGVSDLDDVRRDVVVTDETDDTATRRICVHTKNKGINVTKLYLDASGLEENMLGYLALYTDIVNGFFVSAGEYDTKTLRALTGGCTTGSMQVSLSASSDPDDFRPYVTVDFSCTPSMTDRAYELAYTRLFDSRFDDPTVIKEAVSLIRDTVGKNIEKNPDRIACLASGAAYAPQLAYDEYTHYVEYYDFLGNLEDSIGGDYKNICAKLQSIGEYLNNSNGAVIGCALSPINESGYKRTSDEFTAKLKNRARDDHSCDLAGRDYPCALVTGGSVVSNAVGAPVSSDDPANSVALRIMTEQYLRPLLRSGYGTYGCSFKDAYPAVVVYTTGDTNVRETLDVYSQMGSAWKDIRKSMTQEDLDGYIMTMYLNMSVSSGELSDAVRLIDEMVSGRDAAWRKDALRRLKSLKLKDLERFDALFEELSENGSEATAGSADLINDNKDIFVRTITPFE